MKPSPGPIEGTAAELAELRGRSERYRHLLENLPVGVFEADPAGDGRVLAANAEGLRLLGYDTLEELRQRRTVELYADPEERRDLMDRVAESGGRPIQLVRHFLRRQGERVPVSIIVQRVDVEGKPRLFGIIQTVEERKRIEEERNRLLEAIEISCEAINIAAPDGSLVYTNRAMDDLFGYERGELIGKHISILNVPEVHPALVAEITSAVESKGRWEGEIRNRRKSGEEFVCYAMITAVKDDDGKTLNYLGAQHDITERKKADEARERYASRIAGLRQLDVRILRSEAIEQIAETALDHLAGMVDCQRASIVALDPGGSGGAVIAARGAEDAGAAVGTLLPAALFDALGAGGGYEPRRVEDAEDSARLSPLDRALSGEGVRSCVSVPLVADGRLLGALHLGAQRARAFDDRGRAVIRDVADVLAMAMHQHRLRERAHRTTQELERAVAERTSQLETANAELEYLTASLVDELQAPLRAVMGLTREMLEWHASKMGKEVKLLAGAVENAAVSMREHLDAIHEFTAIGQRVLEPREIDMNRVAREAVERQTASPKDRAVRFSVGDLPPAQGDLFLVSDLWGRLLDNAVKFTRGNRKPRVEIGAERSGGETVYYVKDNGAGFDMAQEDRLFAMFKRLHSLIDFPGLGVGLACAKRIVSRHGGRIWGEGETGRGAQFRFTLPNR